MVCGLPSSSPRCWQSHSMHLGVLLKGAPCSPKEFSGAAGSPQGGSAVVGVRPWFGDVVLSMAVLGLCSQPSSLPNSRESSWQLLAEKHEVKDQVCSCGQGSPGGGGGGGKERLWRRIDRSGGWLQAGESNHSLLEHPGCWPSLTLCLFKYSKFSF